MDFLNEVAGAWKKGSEVVIKDDNGNDISLQKGINYVMNEAKKYEELSKTKDIEINKTSRTNDEDVK